MHLKPEELPDKGFILAESMDHKDLAPFVNMYMKKKTLWSVLYYALNIVFVLLITAYFLISLKDPQFSVKQGLAYLGGGFALAFTLVPLHEFIHVLAYRTQGATTTSYDANWKKFYFLAIADKFVADRREFTIVALAPFVCITIILIIFIFFASQLWALTWMGTLLAHTSFCAGDFALLSYFRHHKDKNVVTYDDKENGISYFYHLTGK